MFGGAAVSLLKLMGQSGNVPGALLAADIPEALQTLHDGLAKLSDEQAPAAAVQQSADEDEAPPVALHTRAGPLITLLEAAKASNDNVLWDS